MGPTSSARAGGRMGSGVATPGEAGGGAGATGDGAGVDETGVGDVVGVGVEPPQPAMSPRSNTGMCRGVMVDSTARRLRGVGRGIRPSARGERPASPRFLLAGRPGPRR